VLAAAAGRRGRRQDGWRRASAARGQVLGGRRRKGMPH
jgi:hypothetical protein